MAYDVERRPGAWVAEQAGERSHSFVLFFWMAAVSWAFAIGLWFTGHRGLGLVVWIGCTLFIYAARAMVMSLDTWAPGAHAEVATGEALNALRYDGYIVMHDVMFGGQGNLDHIVIGENGAFLVETKARRYEKRHLGKVKYQAKLLHDELDCWVTPVICVGDRDRVYEHSRVLITGRSNVADAIRSRPRRGHVDMTSVRNFADRVS